MLHSVSLTVPTVITRAFSFIADLLNNKEIHFDNIIKAIYSYNISRKNFDKLIMKLDESHKHIFINLKMIYDSKESIEIDIITRLQNVKKYLDITYHISNSTSSEYSKSEYSNVVREYIHMLTIKKINELPGIVNNLQYCSIMRLHPYFSAEFLKLSKLSNNYLLEKSSAKRIK